MKKRLSYTSVVATLALFLAIGGTTAVGANALLTGKAVKDESLTGADIQNNSLTGADIRTGSLGSNSFSAAARANLKGATGDPGEQGETGPAGPAGPAGEPGQGVKVAATAAPGITGYVDMDTIATATLPRSADYVVFARITATNTGGSDDNLNCALFIGSQAVGGGGADVAAGATASASVVGAISVTAPQDVALRCMGNGVTTFDIANVAIRTHDLG